MTKILAALGVGAALMLTPVLAYADDAAAPAPKAEMAPAKPMKHHKHHAAKKPAKHHHMAKAPKKMDDKKMDKPAEAPKS
jgi:hypothetical protein